MSANNMTTRETDDMILRFLELRTEGMESKEIGYMFGVSSARVRSTTNNVVNVDMELHDDMIAFGKVKK